MALNPIDKAIADIKFSIPKQILKKVFLNNQPFWTPQNTSLEEQIKLLVIQAKVLPDCDIVGGTKVYIPTSNIPREYTDQFTVIFRVPKQMTQGRTITSVLAMSYLESNTYGQTGGSGQMNPCSVNAVTENALAVFGANASAPVISTAECSLVAENTVMVKDTLFIKPNGFLWCELANPTNLSNIQIRSLPYFSKLCVLACKAFIYNEFIVQLDEGEIKGGHVLGVFRNIIESYSEALTEYNEFLTTTWATVAFMNDTRSYTDFIRMQTGGRR